MKMFKTIGPIGLNAGSMVLLTKEQAASREHALVAVKAKGGLYQVKGRIEFKAGESFGFDGDLPKNLVEFVEADKAAKKGDQKAPAKTPAEVEAEARAEAEKAALEAWNKDAALREQHGGDFPAYIASLAKA